MVKYLLLALILAPAAAYAAGPTTKPDRTEREAFELTATSPATPLLKFRLTVDPAVRHSGNAALAYYRAMIDVPAGLEIIDTAESDHLAGKSLAEDAKLNDFFDHAKPVFAELLAASECTSSDWGDIAGGQDGVMELMPLLSHARELANLLRVRAWQQMDQGRTADAMSTIREEFALAGNIRKGTPLVGGMVGNSIDQVGQLLVEGLMRRPDAPNLYWPLRTLPDRYPTFATTMAQERQWASLKPDLGMQLSGMTDLLKAAQDEMEVAASLPPPEAVRMLDQIIQRNKEKPGAGSNVLTAVAMPSYQRSVLSWITVDRSRAAMINVEAIRSYAAAHGGALPKSLADLGDTPAVDNPATGGPFAYKTDGATATITDDTSPVAADGRPLIYTVRVRNR